MNGIKLLGKLALAALFLSASAHAEIVQYNFTAQGTSLEWGPPCGRYYCPPVSSYGDHHLATMLNATSTISGSFFYDTELKTLGHYESNGRSTDYYQDFNRIGSSFVSDTGFHYANNDTRDVTKPQVSVNNEAPSSLWVRDGVTIDTWQVDRYGASEGLSLEFRSKVGNGLLSDSSLPGTLSLDNFDGKVSLFWSNGGPYQFFYANITSLSLAPVTTVPEPATYAMLGAGFACLALAKRRQRRRQAA
jgi:hypothetical protein